MSEAAPETGNAAPKTYSAEDVRQGEIILRRPWQRVVFIGGLVGCVLLLLIWYIFAAR